MCLYRQQPDMASAMRDWIDPLVAGDEEHDPIPTTSFSWEGSDKDGWCLYYNGAPKIWFRYITQVNHIKQEVFSDDMNWVWLDEFIPLVYKKLPGVVSEGDAIRTIMKTIEHDTVRSREEKGLKPLRMIMFANPFTWNNPILGYFKVVPRGYGIWRVGPDIVCEMLPPYEKERKGKMTADEFLGDEVNKNQGWLDESAYVVDKWPKGAVPLISLRLGRNFYVVYESAKRYYVRGADKHHTGCRMVVGSLDGMCENEMSWEMGKWRQHLQTRAYSGRIWFSDINVKFQFITDISARFLLIPTCLWREGR